MCRVFAGVITGAESKFADGRVRAFTTWEGWRGYDVNEYQKALRKSFEPFEHYVPTFVAQTAHFDVHQASLEFACPTTADSTPPR